MRGNTTMAGMPRSVVVTGAADGIGRGIATRFAEMGDRVALLDYDADKLARTTAELTALGGQVLGIPTDVRSRRRSTPPWRRLRDGPRWSGRCGQQRGGLSEHRGRGHGEDEWDAVLDTNLKGAFLFLRAAARAMMAQRRGGKLCAITSGAYRSARRGAAHYCASKAGLVLLAQTLALELAEHEINVNVVSPGFIEVGLRPGSRWITASRSNTTSRWATSASQPTSPPPSRSCAPTKRSSSQAAC